MANNIKDRIQKIKPYFKGMQVEEVDGESVIYVMVSFPPKWLIDKTLEQKYDITIGFNNNNGTYYFCADMGTGFDVIFDAIDENIEQMITAQERAKLLKDKVQELQELFIDESIPIDKLRTIEFTFKPQKKKTTKKDTKEITEPDNQLTANEEKTEN